MDLQLKDKVALVTGGSKGIGLGIVRSLIAEGAKVANVNRSSEEGLQLEKEYAALGKECVFIQGDLTDLAACKNAVDPRRERWSQSRSGTRGIRGIPQA